ncbi:phosphoribosylaminoimidazolesuccinocarboxamide synthase [Dehalogenimonas alkenigignens]|uniref:Phosphoribosylaminoimidazole-succinocarboxamide synthase n=1 Tax=Dehalogenimonas alkenigignens TaxID=1217799 RepID=A0A0W0GJG2_9CHLR|nr:phosphoribosylaminoimidazolesuccinocarboxamide synthase [Dehalogenimonas alkenigignens]KTB48692.1 phosphoribosylaminoimidazole-succinocarboxamide synthase [Dehalogenimonas alkenigignens]PVV84890.1 phosphoribosylaminoimidazolesuccinocarboxamide synthase [Dehalogenimonas alkenigignens]
MTDNQVVLKTDLPLKRFISGKVRDTYDLGEHLLIVVTDRVSAFDVVLPAGIPDKGRVLNLISAFWFGKTKNIISNHVVAVIEDVRQLDEFIPEAQRFDYPKYLEGRSMVVKKVKRLPVECVVRGYLAGSGWSEYKKRQSVCGVSLPAGLRQSEMLPEPVFTPTTKGEDTHDLPMTYEEVENTVGRDLALKLKSMSIVLYAYARDYARHHGIIIADTKFEFGLNGDKLILIDEALTPDSSRFWDEKLYKVGEPQDSYDKQPLRDWLENSGWNKEPPAPTLPPEVTESTRRRYVHAFEVLTGKRLP